LSYFPSLLACRAILASDDSSMPFSLRTARSDLARNFRDSVNRPLAFTPGAYAPVNFDCTSLAACSLDSACAKTS
jgi:hypothetical protein